MVCLGRVQVHVAIRREKYVLYEENINDISYSDPPAAETIRVSLHYHSEEQLMDFIDYLKLSVHTVYVIHFDS